MYICICVCISVRLVGSLKRLQQPGPLPDLGAQEASLQASGGIVTLAEHVDGGCWLASLGGP